MIASAVIVRRTLYIVAWAALAWALIAAATGGLGWTVGPLRVSSRQPLRPAIVGIVLAVIYLRRYSREESALDGAWALRWLRRAVVVASPVAVVLALVIGIHYGSFTAGGSDSYGYVSQASLWLHHHLHIKQPWVSALSWPQRDWASAPLGYKPSSPDGTIVPTYPPGLPMLMALFEGIFGPNGPFFVVPVFGALAVAFTYLLSIDVTGSRGVGACAAFLLLLSPVFLAHVTLPMTDVPMAAGWTIVIWLALRRRAFAAGIVTALMLMIRPNLLLLAAAPAVGWIWPAFRQRARWGDVAGRLFRFALGVMPAVIAVALVNVRLYGSPFESGYGGLSGDMYELGRMGQNLRLYTRWLVQSQTIFVALAIVPLVIPDALRRDERDVSIRATLVALVGLSAVSYIFYYVFGVWLYLRYLLPALPVIFILMAAGIRAICVRLPLPAVAPAAVLLMCCCLPFSIRFALDQRILNQYEFEQRHIKAAQSVAALTPPTAMILAVQHSGSIRYYSGRTTLRYDYVPADGLDAAIAELYAKGYRPFIVIDDWEETDFRNRFGKSNRVGRLDWRPLMRVLTNPEVRIYDPEGRATPAQ